MVLPSFFYSLLWTLFGVSFISFLYYTCGPACVVQFFDVANGVNTPNRKDYLLLVLLFLQMCGGRRSSGKEVK
jgi:hypothetical protein